MWRNTLDSWGTGAKALHWFVVLLIVVEVPAGFIMGLTFGATDPVKAAWHAFASNYHHTAGLLILLIAGVRLVWRLLNVSPEHLSPASPIERVLAAAVHGALYTLLILIPLSGWAALSSLASSPAFGPTQLWFFGTDGFGPHGLIPHIVRPVPYDVHNRPFTYGFFIRAHVWLLLAGAALLTLHLAAVLRHHLLLKNDILLRMLPRRRRPD